MNRRKFLATTGAGIAGTVAGCVGGGGGEGTTSDGTGTDGDAGGDSSLEAHPAAAGIESQPRLGEFGGHAIVAFEDPSCPRCAAFERDTVPEVREKLVEPGKAAFVFRNYPVVYPWGEPASQALEATFARDETAFWTLLDHYVSNQRSFSTENVLEKTATFLDDETDLDGSAVAEDAETEAHGDAVELDLQAGRDADVGRTTPTVLLFRDGEYATRAAGSVSYQVIASALGE